MAFDSLVNEIDQIGQKQAQKTSPAAIGTQFPAPKPENAAPRPQPQPAPQEGRPPVPNVGAAVTPSPAAPPVEPPPGAVTHAIRARVHGLNPEERSRLQKLIDEAQTHTEAARLLHHKALMSGEPVTDAHMEISSGIGKAAVLGSLLAAALDPSHQAGPAALGALTSKIEEHRNQLRQEDAQRRQLRMQAGLGDAQFEQQGATQARTEANQLYKNASERDKAYDKFDEDWIKNADADRRAADAETGRQNRFDQSLEIKKGSVEDIKKRAEATDRQHKQSMYARMYDSKEPSVHRAGALGLLTIHKKDLQELEAEDKESNAPIIEGLKAAIGHYEKTASEESVDHKLKVQKLESGKVRYQRDIQNVAIAKEKLKALQEHNKVLPLQLQQGIQKVALGMLATRAAIANANLRGEVLRATDPHLDRLNKETRDTIAELQRTESMYSAKIAKDEASLTPESKTALIEDRKALQAARASRELLMGNADEIKQHFVQGRKHLENLNVAKTKRLKGQSKAIDEDKPYLDEDADLANTPPRGDITPSGTKLRKSHPKPKAEPKKALSAFDDLPRGTRGH